MSEEDLYIGRAPWSMALEGFLALIIGALFLAWPGMVVVTITWMAGLFAFITGICAFIAMIGAPKGMRGILIAGGLLGIIFGCIFLAWPVGTTAVLLWLLMLWLLFYGIYKICIGIWQPSDDHSRWFDICLGLITVIIAVMLFAIPGVGATAFVLALLLGIYAVIVGIILICLAGATWSKRRHMSKG